MTPESPPPSSWSRRARRLTRAPLLHFLALGGLLFIGQRLVFPDTDRLVVVIDERDVRDLEKGWTARTGRPWTPEERRASIEAEIDDRLLIEEAIALGWHREDAIVDRRLIANQRFLSPDDPASDEVLLDRARAQGMDRSDLVVRRRLLERQRLRLYALGRAEEPTRQEILAYYADHADRFERPERVRLTQVFLSRDRRGEALAEDAASLATLLARDDIPPDEATRYADPFLVPADLPPSSEAELQGRLGPAFAAAVMRAPVGRWSGPIESPYGLHLVFVHAHQPAERPALSEVEGRVRGELERAQEVAALRAHVAALRERATISVRIPPD